MSQIHRTTLTPSKLELAAGWLVGRPWYRGDGHPELAKAGGFRLDDPDGEVGCEFMVVRDADGTCYHLPVTYRGAPLPDGDDALIGTTEHGVLGTRWVYDGENDPLLRELVAGLFNGELPAQAQSESDALDDTVQVRLDGDPAVANDVEIVRVPAAGDDGTGDGVVTGIVQGSDGPVRVVLLRRR